MLFHQNLTRNEIDDTCEANKIESLEKTHEFVDCTGPALGRYGILYLLASLDQPTVSVRGPLQLVGFAINYNISIFSIAM